MDGGAPLPPSHSPCSPALSLVTSIVAATSTIDSNKLCTQPMRRTSSSSWQCLAHLTPSLLPRPPHCPQLIRTSRPLQAPRPQHTHSGAEWDINGISGCEERQRGRVQLCWERRPMHPVQDRAPTGESSCMHHRTDPLTAGGGRYPCRPTLCSICWGMCRNSAPGIPYSTRHCYPAHSPSAAAHQTEWCFHRTACSFPQTLTAACCCCAGAILPAFSACVSLRHQLV